MPSLIKTIWRERADVVFTTLGHVNLLVALLRPVLPKRTLYIARESSIISFRNRDERYPGLFNILFKTVYRSFDGIICQSQIMKRDLMKNFKLPETKAVVINNPVDFSMIPPMPERSHSDLIQLISIGQLRPEKGYERVIHALAHCSVKFHYTIVGGGDQKILQNLIDHYKMDDQITLHGADLCPNRLLIQSDVLILGSYDEGFPNVVLEANACGIPVIAFEGIGGHYEIIEDGKNGWFVNSPAHLNRLLQTGSYKKLESSQIIKVTRDRYDLSHIIKRYEDYITTMHSSRPWA